MMVTSEKLNGVEILTRFFCLTTSWFLDDMVLVVNLAELVATKPHHMLCPCDKPIDSYSLLSDVVSVEIVLGIHA